MTAEIAIMNLQAVALAADSAVTVTTYPDGNQKIFSSANKLFALSDIAPVGILVYGNASFMSIPWETIVKEYRRNLGRKTFAYLHEYSTDFCKFVTKEIGNHVSEQQQLDYAKELAEQIFAEMKYEIHRRTEQILYQATEGSARSEYEVAQLEDELTREVVNEYHLRAKKANLIEGTPENFEKMMRKELSRYLKTTRTSVFGQQHIQRGFPQKLNYIALKAIGGFFDDVTRYSPSSLTSGVVVSGFGDRDIFPVMSLMRIEGMVQDRLKVHFQEKVVLSAENPSTIVPFAQIDMVRQFMEGIAPDYLPYLHRSVISHLENYTDDLLDMLGYSDIDIEKFRGVLDKYYPQLADLFIKSVKEVGVRHFSEPIIRVVAMLPKEQLAEMAESLVNLTALKKRVSSQEETVGGPIDVALITKGDGLIWIKRKHYFAPELNPSYFARTSYRRMRDEQDITRVEDDTDA